MINQHEHQHQLAVNRDIRLRSSRRLSRRLDIGTAVYIIVIAILIALAATTRATEPVAVMAGTNGVVATPAALEARIAAAPNATLLVYQGTNIVGTLALDPASYAWDGTNLVNIAIREINAGAGIDISGSTGPTSTVAIAEATYTVITGAVQQTDQVYTSTVAKASGALPRDGSLPMAGDLDMGVGNLLMGQNKIVFESGPTPTEIEADGTTLKFLHGIDVAIDADVGGILTAGELITDMITFGGETRTNWPPATAARTNTAIAATATNLTLAATAWQHVTVTNAVTFAWTNTVADAYTISAAVGTNAITWPANWTWLPDAYPPEGSNIVVSVWPAPAGGTNWYAVGGGK